MSALIQGNYFVCCLFLLEYFPQTDVHLMLVPLRDKNNKKDSWWDKLYHTDFHRQTDFLLSVTAALQVDGMFLTFLNVKRSTRMYEID